ncbi:MAG: acyl-CoA thioesterase [Gammaproteobacteria bacterium]|nr:acyl-CoA thioesterase [Gammaproteobacteria bacterium]
MQFPKDKQPAIRVFAMPADTNSKGDIFGGWLMSQVDLAGSVAAYRRAGSRVATVAVNNFQFIKPVFVGDLVSIFSDVIKVGTTSIQVSIQAFSERVAKGNETLLVAEATLTYVAIDDNHRPTPVKTI